MKKIFVLQANPDTDSYCGQLATAYEESAREAGHEVERVNLADMQFDPILHHGYKQIQELEPDLVRIQELFLHADHIVIVYPNWWCTMPALLKGMFDRMWLPGFAFNFNKETKKCDKHLKGKTARVIIVGGSHSPWQTWWKYGDFTNEITHGTLGFAGIKSTVTALGPTEKVNDKKREGWIKKIKQFGKKGV